MFWRMAGLSTVSPVESILDKDQFTLEELLDEDEIIQECKVHNNRLINFLREKPQMERLVRYIVEEPFEEAEKKHSFKFPFVACEIFTCEVDIMLKTLVEDDKLMDLLFSFLEPGSSHTTSLAGYFSKVVVCLMLRKTLPVLNYIRGHQAIFHQLVDLIGIPSIMEILIRLLGADEHMYNNYIDSMPWLEDTDVLEIIVDKFRSSNSSEVHANAAETLCAIIRFGPLVLATKISSPSFVAQVLHHALDASRPKSVLIHSLSICISLLDPKRQGSTPYNMYRSQPSNGSFITTNLETMNGMLASLGDLLKLLDHSSSDAELRTSYGKLQPPLGKHRLKIVEFLSVLSTIDNETVQKELVQQGAIQRTLDLFFEYPFNNFLHHHVEHIILSCLESKNALLVEHLFKDCNIVGKILYAESHCSLSTDANKTTIPAQGKVPPRIGNIGHMTNISNKLVQLGNSNSQIQSYLQEYAGWKDWCTNVLLKRNALENVHLWNCGRPTSLQNRNRDSDDEDFRDRDYDVARLANNLSQAFRYGIYNNDDSEEVHGSLERDDEEDVYLDDESAEVVLSSLRLGDAHSRGDFIFPNSNWFAFDENQTPHEDSSISFPSSSPSQQQDEMLENKFANETEDLVDTACSMTDISSKSSQHNEEICSNLSNEEKKETLGKISEHEESNNPPEWVEWRETLDMDTKQEVDETVGEDNQQPSSSDPLLSCPDTVMSEMNTHTENPPVSAIIGSHETPISDLPKSEGNNKE